MKMCTTCSSKKLEKFFLVRFGQNQDVLHHTGSVNALAGGYITVLGFGLSIFKKATIWWRTGNKNSHITAEQNGKICLGKHLRWGTRQW